MNTKKNKFIKFLDYKIVFEIILKMTIYLPWPVAGAALVRETKIGVENILEPRLFEPTAVAAAAGYNLFNCDSPLTNE